MDHTTQQQACWEAALEELKQSISSASFAAWFKPLKLHSVTADTVICEVPDRFIITNLKQRYLTMLVSAVTAAFGRPMEIVLSVPEDLNRQSSRMNESMLSSRYTFDNFVVGPSNRFAYAASVAVAEGPDESYNPLFIYGGVGLGKTHLMNAIGNEILAKDPGMNVLFISSESFTNEFIETLVRKKGTNELREKLRSVDVLMVDDIQFLSKTVATQEEFFHTFNHLYSRHKQIILSSDRPPKEIPTIEERLRSRFEWGLTVDIRKPDLETRIAILRRKCEEDDFACGDDVLDYIARRVDSNIREMEGALNRLRAGAVLMGGKVDLAFAEETLEALIPAGKAGKLDAAQIIETVAEHYAVTSGDLTGKKRNREFILPRQICMYLIREMLGSSTTSIGRDLGDRDHSTVMHGCRQIEESMSEDPTFRKSIEELKEQISHS